jgi:hypothetical protein
MTMAQEDVQVKSPKIVKNPITGYLNARTTGTSIFLTLLGVIVLAIWAVTYNASNQMSMLLFLAGIGVLTVAILLYFFTPSRFVRDDICDAMAVSDVMSLNKMMSSLLIDSKGIYIPADKAGATRLFIPLSSKDINIGNIEPGPGIFNSKGPVKGLTISPPGHGLFLYTLGIGAAFTDEGLENEVRDVLVNGLELAADAEVKRESGLVLVSLKDLVNKGLCSSIRGEDASVCTRTGCPICSFVACMVATGTGKNTRIKDIEVDGKTIKATFELL